MAKLCLNYRSGNDSVLGDVLKIKIDEQITAEVNKNEIYEIDLENGNHNIKMYYQGWTENDMVGYLDQNIMVNGDTYLIYKSPATIYGKAKLIQKNFNSVEEFRKFVAKKNKIAKIVGIILFIIALIILFIFN